jgi:hypothetical protein
VEAVWVLLAFWKFSIHYSVGANSTQIISSVIALLPAAQLELLNRDLDSVTQIISSVIALLPAAQFELRNRDLDSVTQIVPPVVTL